MHDDDHPLLIAYVSGDLPPDAARAFAARIEADPALQAELAGLRAVRELLDRDAQWGERSGADAPPPHLVDAILRAEVLARPPELRTAIAKRRDARPFLAKVTTWLVGGGVLAGAAAAVLLVAQADRQAPRTAAEAAQVAMRDAPAAAPAPMAAPMDAPAVANADPMASDLRLDEPKLEAAARAERKRELSGDDGQGFGRAAGAFADGAPAQDLKAAVATRGKADAVEREAPGAAPLGGGATLGRAGELATGSSSTSASSPIPVVAPPPPKTPMPASKSPAPDPPPPPAVLAKEARAVDEDDAAPAKKGEAQSKQPDALAQEEGAYAGDKVVAAPAPARPAATTTPPAEKDSTTPTTKDNEKAKAKKAPVSAGPPALSPEMKKLADETRAARQQDAAKSTEKPEATKQRTDADRARRTQAAQMALATGARELGLGRAMEAIDAFEEADVLDRGVGALGVDPVVGQMRAYEQLKRYDDVLKLVPRLPADAQKPGVADGLLIAARAAEARGDARRATDLYNKVATVRAKRAEAQKALRRMAMDDAAEAAPKAAAPAAKE